MSCRHLTCNEAMDLYCSLDQGQPFPEELEAHLSSCSSCRQHMARLDEVWRAYRQTGSYEPPYPLEERILAAIEVMESTPEPEPVFSLTPAKWIIPAILLTLGIIGIPFSTVFSTFTSSSGMDLEIVVPLVMGIVFTAYTALFTGYNLDWLKKKFLT